MKPLHLSQGAQVKFTAPDVTGTRAALLLNGEDISHFAKAVTFRAAVGTVTEADIELVGPTFDIEAEAFVFLTVRPFPGHVVVEETTANGKRWRSVPEDEA